MDYNLTQIGKGVPVNQAVLKIKHLSDVSDSGDVLFEDMIDDENNLISIDFSNGKTLCENGFSRVHTNSDKYYLEFFDNIDYKNIIDYLEDDNSNFRVTDVYGTIVRPSFNDLESLGYNTSGEKIVVRVSHEKDV